MSPEIVNGIFTVLVALCVISLAVLWLMALYQVITRKDLRESKVLWVLLLLFIAPIGVIAYFFTEQRTRYGVLSILAFLLLIALFVAYPILLFTMAAKG